MIWDRLWEAVHGHLGVLATVALVHPAWLLWRGRPLSSGIRWTIGLSTALTASAFSFGLAAYERYRQVVKPELFRADPRSGWLFETKEHLAYATLVLAIGACIVALSAPREQVTARRIAARLYASAAVLCAIVSGLGTWIASVRGF